MILSSHVSSHLVAPTGSFVESLAVKMQIHDSAQEIFKPRVQAVSVCPVDVDLPIRVRNSITGKTSAGSAIFNHSRGV